MTFWHLGLYDSAVNFRDLYRTVSIDEACRESVIDWQSEAGLQITSLLSGTLSYIRVLGVIELIEFNHSGLFGVVG